MYLSVCLSLSACMPACLSLRLLSPTLSLSSVYVSVCLSLPACLPVCLSAFCLPLYLLALCISLSLALVYCGCFYHLFKHLLGVIRGAVHRVSCDNDHKNTALSVHVSSEPLIMHRKASVGSHMLLYLAVLDTATTLGHKPQRRNTV